MNMIKRALYRIKNAERSHNQRFPIPKWMADLLIFSVELVGIVTALVIIVGGTVAITLLDFWSGAVSITEMMNAETQSHAGGILGMNNEAMAISLALSFVLTLFWIFAIELAKRIMADGKIDAREKKLIFAMTIPGIFVLVMSLVDTYGIDAAWVLHRVYPSADIRMIYKDDGDLGYKIFVFVWTSLSLVGEVLPGLAGNALRLMFYRPGAGIGGYDGGGEADFPAGPQVYVADPEPVQPPTQPGYDPADLADERLGELFAMHQQQQGGAHGG